MRYCLLALFAIATSVHASDLPPSAYPVLFEQFHAEKILGADNIKQRTVDGFDYLGFRGRFEVWQRVPAGFDPIYRPEVVLRKSHADSDWSKASVLVCSGRLNETFRLPDKRFVRTLFPWRD